MKPDRMVDCPACDKRLSRQAKSCPECGHEMDAGGKGATVVICLIGVVAVGFILNEMGKHQAKKRIQDKSDLLQLKIDANQRQQDAVNDVLDDLNLDR